MHSHILPSTFPFRVLKCVEDRSDLKAKQKLTNRSEDRDIKDGMDGAIPMQEAHSLEFTLLSEVPCET